MQELADHVQSHMGPGFNIRKMAWVKVARTKTTRVLERNNTFRAMTIHDGRMYEAYQCFDGAYASDSWLMAQSNVSEYHGLRASCVYLHLRQHWIKSSGEDGGPNANLCRNHNPYPRP